MFLGLSAAEKVKVAPPANAFGMNEATARIKINKLLEAAGADG
jgi:hypothetical protein